ncbi:MAG: hypothetical protein FJ145_10080 [Deltaproteobacteria bacterium]|nr:hypothetical protein [Deltaproteobacteria bacterium]
MQAPQLPAPYQEAALNMFYNLLFCDEPSLFKPKTMEATLAWQDVLFNPAAQESQIRSLADDAGEESRIRLLAYNLLRAQGHAVPARTILGLVVEVALPGGLDVLAAYADRRVRYINHSGKVAVFEGAPPELAAKAKEAVEFAQVAVNQIGPWDMPRLPAPKPGNVRLTFLVSDGLYFGEGPFAVMQDEPMAAPIIQKASELLQLIVNAAAEE